MVEHRVVAVRATGRTDSAVAADIAAALVADGGRWQLFGTQPVVYNSSASGYLFLFLTRAPQHEDGAGRAMSTSKEGT